MSTNYKSPQFEGFHSVGWIQSAHGIRGELFLRLFAGKADWCDEVESLALLKKGETKLHFFKIRRAKAHKDGLIVQLEGLPDRTEAETWVKASAYVSNEILIADPGESVYLKQIEGFEIVDPQGLKLGIISGFASNGPQDLLEVRLVQGQLALVPLVDAFLIHIDFDKRQVSMDLPPGLLNIEE